MKSSGKQVLNTIKMLGLDMIDKSQSGHPGIVLGTAPILYTLYGKQMIFNPKDPDWINRDRFVLSSGHGSALLYATLFMSGFKIEIEDLKNFRNNNSITPGHPEYGVTPGVDCSTGPLGQGLGNAVGMALAERYLANLLNTKEHEIINYYTYCLCGDGDLMEGISHEVASFAGHQKLNKLIVLYDCNHVTLDGKTDLTFSEDVAERFEAYNFNIIKVKNGNSVNEINGAIEKAQKAKQPSLIIVETTIGKDSLIEKTNKVHGGPLNKEDLTNIRKKLNVCSIPFEILKDDKEYISVEISKRCDKEYALWEKTYNEYQETLNEKKKNILKSLEKNKLFIEFDSEKFKFNATYHEEIRKTNQEVLSIISKKTSLFIGGSADLSTSCKTKTKNSEDMDFKTPLGTNINFGVREHGMGAILNGMSLCGLRTYGSTFLTFSDYLKPAIRMSALMNLPVTYIFTHDSVFIGEDGPSHQPVEQLSSLRMIPNLMVFRPADINEVFGAWQYILNHNSPACLVISKEETLKLKNTVPKYVSYGAYMVRRECDKLHGVIVASGTELSLALKVAETFHKEDIEMRVVSMPSMELFLKQDPNYEKVLLPKTVPVIVIEPSNSLIWNRFATSPNHIIGIDDFGLSAKKKELLMKFGYDEESVIKKIRILLDK